MSPEELQGGRMMSVKEVHSEGATKDNVSSAYRMTAVVVASIGLTSGAAVLKKIVPRLSVPQYRVPVPPAVIGSAFAKYELAGLETEALQVVAPVPMSTAPASFARVTVYPLLTTPFAYRSGLMKPWVPFTGAFTRSVSVIAYPPAAQLDE